MGRQPILLSPRKQEQRAQRLHKACSPSWRDACRFYKRGQQSTILPGRVPGWTFSTSGKVLAEGDKIRTRRLFPRAIPQPDALLHGCERGRESRPIRAFLFGSLKPGLKPLAEHLARAVISSTCWSTSRPDGLKSWRRLSSYIYERPNWKLQD